LKLAAPYDAFPSELSARHDEIRIAYEWQFLDGAAQGSSVFYSDSDRPAEAAPPNGQTGQTGQTANAPAPSPQP
jgi:hypothetical protein